MERRNRKEPFLPFPFFSFFFIRFQKLYFIETKCLRLCNFLTDNVNASRLEFEPSDYSVPHSSATLLNVSSSFLPPVPQTKMPPVFATCTQPSRSSDLSTHTSCSLPVFWSPMLSHLIGPFLRSALSTCSTAMSP